jgi:hypothetical protein
VSGKRLLKVLTLAALVIIPVGYSLAQGLPQVVVDLLANAKLAQQILQDIQTYNSIHNQELWWTQIFPSKSAWQAVLGQALNSAALNQFGETAQWSPAMATGANTAMAWSNATVQLQSMQPILAGQPLGIAPMAQLATVESLNAAGSNNLATIGQARSYLVQNVPAMQSLQNTILDPSLSNNSPTQQMALVANATAQNTSTEVQNLQVNTSVLETLTGIAKDVSDSNTADLNLQAKKALTYQTQAVLPGSYGTDFMNHP